MAQFNGVVLTEDTMQKTREWFANNARECIEEVRSGEVKVNDPEAYYTWCEERAKRALEGHYDHTFAFLQRAYFIQTGKSIAFLL
jgi:hypothetical protein